MEEVWKFLNTVFIRPSKFLHELVQPIVKAKVVQERDWKALKANLELLQNTFEQAMEAVMLEIVLHVNTVRQIYEKWPYSERILWLEKTAGVSPMDEPGKFRRYVEEWYPVVLALAAQRQIHYGDGGVWEKKAMGAAAWGGQPRPCRMVSRGCKKNHPLEDCELFKNLSSEAKLAKLQEWSRCLFCLSTG